MGWAGLKGQRVLFIHHWYWLHNLFIRCVENHCWQLPPPSSTITTPLRWFTKKRLPVRQRENLSLSPLWLWEEAINHEVQGTAQLPVHHVLLYNTLQSSGVWFGRGRNTDPWFWHKPCQLKLLLSKLRIGLHTSNLSALHSLKCVQRGLQAQDLGERPTISLL